jgi:hypothetical protein
MAATTSNTSRFVDMLKTQYDPDIVSKASMSSTSTAIKIGEGEANILAKLYNFLIESREEKLKLSKRQSKSELPSATTTTKSKSASPFNRGMVTGLGILGIVAVGAGLFVFSDEIKQKIQELEKLFDESEIGQAFESIKELFDFDDIMYKMGGGKPVDVGGLTMPGGDIASAIEKAANATGVDKSTLYAIARQESGFEAGASAKTSSAKGLFQITEDTFKEIQQQHPELQGKSVMNAEANALAGAYYIKNLQKQLGTTDTTKLYAGHFFGAGGAKKLYAADESESAASILPSAAASNRSIFYGEGGKERTVGEVKQTLYEKVGRYQPAYQQALSGQTGLTTEQVSPSSIGNEGLIFAPGVDQRITAPIADRTKTIQNVFGKRLTITSGYRDPERNEKAGGAPKSAHLRGNAVDVDVSSMSKDERVKLIQTASALGIGGIGIYNNAMHFDIEGRRVWGQNYSYSSIPEWAKGVAKGHLSGEYTGAIQPVESTVTSTPMTQSAPSVPVQQKRVANQQKSVVFINQEQIAVHNQTNISTPQSPFGDLKPHDAVSGVFPLTH